MIQVRQLTRRYGATPAVDQLSFDVRPCRGPPGAALDKVEGVPVVQVPMSQIHDWDTFHDTFAQTLGFPGFYGRNMDAWIDCLTYADEDDGMRAITVGPGEVLTLQLEDCREFRARCPEIYQVLMDCAAFVNWRRFEQGVPSVLALSYH